MKFETLILGPLATNCYLLKKNGEVIIIDPADDSEEIIKACKDFKVVGILVTHHHFDHIGALDKLEKNYDLTHNFFEVPGFNFEIIKTPGHTQDSLSFYFPDDHILFSGDFLFKNGIGRYDFPESNEEQMIESLKKISNYPNDIIVYPGHGAPTILGVEKNKLSKL